MKPTFALDTLVIRMSDPEWQGLDLYQRIHRALRALILQGVLTAGMKLPSSRTLARSLQVARDTVENAYAQLHRDGFIVRREGSGSYVAEHLGQALRGQSHSRRTKPAKSDTASALLSTRGQQWLEQGAVADQQRVSAFATGLPETRIFPTAVWERLQRKVLKEHREHILLHGDPQGAAPLRQAIATYLNLERGANVTAEQIVVLSSTRQALYLCAQLLSDAQQTVLTEDPSYLGAQKSFQAAQAQLRPIPVDEHGICTDTLIADRSNAACVYVTPSHQYPTGATLSLERRLALTQWAAEHGKWIIEDDYDSEFHYDGPPIACVQGVDAYQRTLYLGTFSKTLYPGLRIGYMALPPALVDAFTTARSIMDGHTPQLQQLTLARFMDDGHYAAHIRAMRKLYAARREVLFNALEKHLADVVHIHRPAGGLQVPCWLKAGWDEAQTIRCAASVGIRLQGLSRLYQGPQGKQGWLLGYASLTEHEIEVAVQRLAKALAKLQMRNNCI